MRHYIFIFLWIGLGIQTQAQTPITIVKGDNYTIDAASGSITLNASGSIALKPGTWIKNGSTFTAKIVPDTYTAVTFSNNQNYIHTRNFQAPTTTGTVALNKDVIEQITYFDGLGRPMQSIGIKAAPDKKDILTHIDYDTYGRQDKDWLPYYEPSGSIGSYRGNKATATKSYYQTHFGDDFQGVTVTDDINPYSQKSLEDSPRARVLRQAAPGKDWKLDSGNEIRFTYDYNATNKVRLFTVTMVPSTSRTPSLTGGTSYYGLRELFKTITKDENHSGSLSKLRTTEEFKDKQGRVVLKRTYASVDLNNDGDTADTGESQVAHDTYYVYDDFGNLTYVIPPKVDTSDGVSATELAELCYQYKYDNRNRLVEKKIPGKGTQSNWEEIVYNKRDQPILTRDPKLKALNQWLFTKYDAFGRVVYTGIMNGSGSTSRATVQGAADSTSPQHETKSGATTLAGTTLYYTNTAYPTSIAEIHTINYYDNYAFDGFVALPATVEGQAVINYNNAASSQKHTKGLPTGTKVRVLTTNNWITTVTGYDNKGRPIYIKSDNPYLSSTDIVENKLDFAGKVELSKSTHKKVGKADIVTVDTFTYDHMGRLIDQAQKINNQDTELIVSNAYDNMGQLTLKDVGGKTTASRLQTVNYNYNVRGWLKSINNTASLGNDLFAFKIGYNEGANALYNGNISSTQWRTANDNTLRSYNYQYDALNRITSATNSSSNYNLSSVAYDKNGNITNLIRQGVTAMSGNTVTSYGEMDNLTYSYLLNSNKLMKVADAATLDQYGFKDDAVNASTDSTDDYAYDMNGNMLSDTNKGITSISYNYLNLPTSVAINGNGNTGTISYIYDATGVKLKKTVSTGTTIEYAGNHVYENGFLKFFNHPDGYVEPKDENNLALGFNYVYQYKDHLGNVRLSYMDNNNNGTVDSSEILEENNYYPFGMLHKGYNNVVNSTNPAQKYKYNGKELIEELGLDWYDYGMRDYDSAIARFMKIDRFAQKYFDKSPYHYGANNPILYIDKKGDSIVVSTNRSYAGVPGQPTDKVVSVSNLGATGVSMGSASWNYNETTKEVDATFYVQEYFSPVIASGANNKFTNQNPGIGREIEAHEDGHRDQFSEKFLTKTDFEVKLSTHGGDKEYKGGIQSILDNVYKDYTKNLEKALSDIKTDNPFNLSVDDVKQEQLTILNNNMQNVLDQIEAIVDKKVNAANDSDPGHSDANNRANRDYLGGKMKYLNNKRKIRFWNGN